MQKLIIFIYIYIYNAINYDRVDNLSYITAIRKSLFVLFYII